MDGQATQFANRFPAFLQSRIDVFLRRQPALELLKTEKACTKTGPFLQLVRQVRRTLPFASRST